MRVPVQEAFWTKTGEQSLALNPHEAVVVRRGTWHRGIVLESGTEQLRSNKKAELHTLFVTPDLIRGRCLKLFRVTHG